MLANFVVPLLPGINAIRRIYLMTYYVIWSHIGLQLGPTIRKTTNLRSTVSSMIHTYKKANIIVEFDKNFLTIAVTMH